ncbi:alpha/beta fold hydrolase [Alicyclobacillus suci]|uniref:alpha/beta fold hydrolase n=1 Tax=Alicyclobacillus suci TaxID=2816080 RepID=UPI001A8D989A|nr:hypothetical protein [Alicyclobacillus suci]
MFEEIEAWQRRCNQDAEARLYASETNFEFSITVGDEVVMCCVEDGEYTFRRITFGTAVPDVNLVIPPHYWMQFMQATPPPFFNTFNAMRAHFPEVTVEGDELKWAQFVGLIESVLRFARESQSDICLSSQKSYDVSAIVGRYIHFASSEEKSVVYYEESGNGKPIVFLHTAGSDSRQYRYLLADLEMQQNWHMYALDLPYHGKSDPVGQSRVQYTV